MKVTNFAIYVVNPESTLFIENPSSKKFETPQNAHSEMLRAVHRMQNVLKNFFHETYPTLISQHLTEKANKL